MQVSGQSYNADPIYKSFHEKSFRNAFFCFSFFYIIQLLTMLFVNIGFSHSNKPNAQWQSGSWQPFLSVNFLILLLIASFCVAAVVSKRHLRFAGFLLAFSQVGASMVYIFFTKAWGGCIALMLGLVLISWFQDISILVTSVGLAILGQFLFASVFVGSSCNELFLFLITALLLGFGIVNNNKNLKRLAKECALSKQAQEKALYQLEKRSHFFAHINHEIRSPLNSIIGFLDVLRETQLNEQQTEYVRTVHRCSETLLHIVGNVLDFSKLENGALSVEPHLFNFKELHREVLDMFILTSSMKGLSLELKMDNQIPEIVKLDSQLLKQILINLIGNAVKFTTRGKIEVEVQKEALHSLYTWSVKDTGCGIKEENIENLFDSFYQERASGPSTQRGTGLGLSISKNFIEAMGGRISVCSQLGEGTVFTFSLPVSEI